MSDRKRAIETLKQLRLDYEEFYEEHNNEVTQAYDMAISSLETDEAYQLEYESTTKNDLEVDAISRSDVLKLMQDNWHTHNGDWAMEESMDDIRALPSVTPQEPILDRVRAEIETKYGQCDICEYDAISGWEQVSDIADILQIIDKYKAESEQTNGNDD